MYMIHPILIYLFQLSGLQLTPTVVAVYTFGLIVVSIAAFRYIEKPAMEFGGRVSKTILSPLKLKQDKSR